MDKFVIQGGTPLHGDIYVSGAKNSVVALLPATLLLDAPVILENVPEIKDVTICLTILRQLGADVQELSRGTYRISCAGVNSYIVPEAQARAMRASYYFLGALLGRFGKAKSYMPGGCHIGERPIDQHLMAFEALGASCTLTKRMGADGKEEFDSLTVEKLPPLPEANVPGEQKERPSRTISFNVVSVGATMNGILAAVKAEGMTVLENCAREPHIVDLANFLILMGAKIVGAGTHRIYIEGVSRLDGNVPEGSEEVRTYSVVPDQIEAGTYMVAAAATRGDLNIHGIVPQHLRSIIEKLKEIGVHVVEHEQDNDVYLRVYTEDKPFQPTNIRTEPHPGFPTDMQPQMAVLLVRAAGQSNITEQIWEDRFKYAAELAKMGANINTTRDGAILFGVDALHGAQVNACDLRAGAALVIAGMFAEGTTEVAEIGYIERGYERITEKLSAVGAKIRRVSDDDPRSRF